MNKEFDLNIEEILENWQVHHALREVIANAIDETILSNCKSVEIYKVDDAWYIRDFGRGLNYKHLTQNENKEKLQHKNLIGKFGVGLKDAIATFDRNNINVLIKSKFCNITFSKKPKHKFANVETIHAIIDETNVDKHF
ncbi:MAG: ATP-binding protein, partial [Mycoplasma sp.]|nr:ATP-binding protein [Mycoplasma sp.]